MGKNKKKSKKKAKQEKGSSQAEGNSSHDSGESFQAAAGKVLRISEAPTADASLESFSVLSPQIIDNLSTAEEMLYTTAADEIPQGVLMYPQQPIMPDWMHNNYALLTGTGSTESNLHSDSETTVELSRVAIDHVLPGESEMTREKVRLILLNILREKDGLLLKNDRRIKQLEGENRWLHTQVPETLKSSLSHQRDGVSLANKIVQVSAENIDAEQKQNQEGSSHSWKGKEIVEDDDHESTMGWMNADSRYPPKKKSVYQKYLDTEDDGEGSKHGEERHRCAEDKPIHETRTYGARIEDESKTEGELVPYAVIDLDQLFMNIVLRERAIYLSMPERSTPLALKDNHQLRIERKIWTKPSNKL
ncbi:hypothetical protein O6H91_02G127100 [Diphasiastrum complanatum]|uniref:Uncharacterized protein n=2 Tax=Diphasiastrum complanatum TaxID=34168 RepID=A0ACC2EKH0_DIPCM|nr:hypothetical protein O6H91_20G055100 [Diphasiastrum complanatum]KAJ7566986.1 hypothetical protein O6H91_02G127100 [Diphasiastrum complanatum]